jgi:hypothetical protein
MRLDILSRLRYLLGELFQLVLEDILDFAQAAPIRLLLHPILRLKLRAVSCLHEKKKYDTRLCRIQPH